MKPVVGITTQIIRRSKWYKYVHELGFDAIEINRQNSKLHFSLYFLEKVRRYLEGLELSVHSGTIGVFGPNQSFTRANLAILAAEVDVCSVLGARQLVFHLHDGFLSPEDKNHLREVVSHALDHDVHLLYESNSRMVAEHAYDVLDSFPEIGYVLDLSHLNNGRGRGRLGCEIDDFIAQVKRRVVYVHASNNSGMEDEHNGLEYGTLDWRHVLSLLDLSKVAKIIIEVRSTDWVADSRDALLRFLNGDLTSTKHPGNHS